MGDLAQVNIADKKELFFLPEQASRSVKYERLIKDPDRVGHGVKLTQEK
jgi:hypothetical protein